MGMRKHDTLLCREIGNSDCVKIECLTLLNCTELQKLCFVRIKNIRSYSRKRFISVFPYSLLIISSICGQNIISLRWRS